MQPDGNKEQGASRSYQNPVMIGVVLLIAGISVAMIQYKVPTILTELMRCSQWMRRRLRGSCRFLRL